MDLLLLNKKHYQRLQEFEAEISKGKHFTRTDLGF